MTPQHAVEIRPGPPGIMMASVSDPDMVLAEVKDKVIELMDAQGYDHDRGELVLTDSLVLNIMFGDYTVDEDQPDGLFRPANPIERPSEWWASMPTPPAGDWSNGGRMFFFSLEGFDVYNMIDALHEAGTIDDQKAYDLLAVVGRALGDHQMADLAEEARNAV